ncbi:MAG TPA: ABC transporter substrate-binding protein [Anaerolineales bacterium]|nr:ABC transporter substrate-binding protein [Anaerolineales bacterium]
MSSKKQKLLALSFLVVGVVLLSACGGATPAPEEAAPVPEEAAAPAEQEPIIIGAVFDRTGWMAAYDDPPRSAAFLAVKVLNERGGILGRPVELIEIDGKTDPALVGTAARQLIEQGAQIIIAPCDFDIGAPASQAAQEAGMVGTSTCASSPLYGSEVLGDLQFTASVWNNNLAGAGAEWGYNEKGWRTAAVVNDTAYEYTQSLGELFKEGWTDLGGVIVSDDVYTAGDEDFSAQIGRIQALPEPPDVIYISGVNPELATILRQVRAAGITTPLMGGDTYDDVQLWAALGPELGNDLYFATHAWLGPEAGGNMVEFLALYEEEYGEPPAAGFTAMGWDVVMVYAQAIEAAGTTDGAAVAAKMEELEFDLLSGHMDWSTAAEGHFPNKEVVMAQLQGAQPSFIGWIALENPPGR